MEFSGEERFNAPQQAVWDFMTDPRRLAECSEGGMQNIQTVDDQHFTFEVHVAGQRIKCDGTWLKRDAPTQAQMQIKGGNFLGRATMVNTLDLSSEGESQTLVKWHADVQVSGILERFGADRIRPFVESANDDLFKCLRQKIETPQTS